MGRPTNADKERELLSEAQENFSIAEAADSENRDLAVEDIRFVDEEGAQWDAKSLQMRGPNRPAYTFDRTSIAIDQVKGDQRQNAMQIIVRPVDNKSDRKTAEIFSGLIRNIEANSSAKAAYNTGFDFALKGGFGAWRVYPKYVQGSFDQELCIERIENPFTVHFGPAKDFLKRDAAFGFISERVSKPLFEAQYPGTPVQSIAVGAHDQDWFIDDEIRIAEYFKRVSKPRTLALLSDGRVVDYDKIKLIEEELLEPLEGSSARPIRVVKTREEDGHVIRWWKISGAGILEGPIDYDWRYIPIVPVFGRVTNIEGKRKYRGLVRKAKDPQKAYNHSRTSMIEATALVPRSPYIITPKQIQGYEDMWNTANVKNWPYLFHNPDPNLPNGGKPMREPVAEVPVALVALAAQASDDIKAATGKFGPSLGEPQANELPGAIQQRNTEGDVSSFEFLDNLAQSIQYTGEILVDMIPQVYDSTRIVRILGIDGKEDFAEINTPLPGGGYLNDLSQGHYDVAVDVGPAYTTQRQETADKIMQLAGVSEMVQQIAPDIIAESLDFTGARKLEKRLRYVMIQQGKIPPSEITEEDREDMPQQPPEPSPSEVALINKLNAEAARAGAQAQEAAAKAEGQAQQSQFASRREAAEIRKLIAEVINEQLDSMLKAKQLGEPSAARSAA